MAETDEENNYYLNILNQDEIDLDKLRRKLGERKPKTSPPLVEPDPDIKINQNVPGFSGERPPSEELDKSIPEKPAIIPTFNKPELEKP